MHIFAHGATLESLRKNKNFRDRGGLARFNVLFMTEKSEENHNMDMTEIFSRKILQLHQHYFSQDPNRTIIDIQLSSEARLLFNEFQQFCGSYRCDRLTPDLDLYLAKHPARALNYACSIHLCNSDDAEEAEKRSISIEEMRGGIEVARFLLHHAEFIHGASGLSAITLAKKVVTTWLMGRFADKGKVYFTSSEAYQGVRGLNAENVKPVLQILEQLNIIRKLQVWNKTLYVVHPQVLSSDFVFS
jgi:hypothetical protein